MPEYVLGPLIAKRVRDAIILEFRRVFSTDALYTYVEDPVTHQVVWDCTKIAINDATPQDFYFLPSINVMTLSGEEQRFLQEDYFQYSVENGNQVERRGAPITFTVGVTAMSLDVITRDEVMDRMYQKLKIVTDDLADRGVGIIRTSLSRDGREYINDRWYYTSGIEMKLYAEWVEESTIDPNSTVDNFSGHIYTDFIAQDFKVDF